MLRGKRLCHKAVKLSTIFSFLMIHLRWSDSVHVAMEMESYKRVVYRMRKPNYVAAVSQEMKSNNEIALWAFFFYHFPSQWKQAIPFAVNAISELKLCDS